MRVVIGSDHAGLRTGMRSKGGQEVNPLKALHEYGQSVWLDYIRRNLILSGELARMVEQDGLRGVTSNPAIFEKAITGSNDYTNMLKLLNEQELSAKEIYEQIAIRDIQDAADVMAPVYKATDRRDGYVSLEVSPHLARNTQGSIEEARRLHKLVGRDNVMIKIPGTPEGIPAIRQLISEGINVNVTLLFSQQAYQQVAEAYIAGLEARKAKRGDLSGIASVASFFVSRIDSAVDAVLQAKLKEASNPKAQELLCSLLGQVAIANAKMAYKRYKGIFQGERWERLAQSGARTQRLLWASTGTKNPKYSDVLYVEQMIGTDTVNTVPPSTLEAFRDHGRVDSTLEADTARAEKTLADLAKAGIPIESVTDKLLEEGLTLFNGAFDKLLKAVEQGCRQGSNAKIDCMEFHLPEDIDRAVKSALDAWRSEGNIRRLWAGDASLWTGADEARWLGWLRITEDQVAHCHHLSEVAGDAVKAGFRDAVLLGMGGSSLTPEVMQTTFGDQSGWPRLQVLDSTDPAQIKSLAGSIDPAKTLFIVSSKSGSTLEPNIFKQFFFERTQRAVGQAEAGNHFIAITDPGSKLQEVAEKDGFRHVFFGLPNIGGRYSALSDFGMAPAAIMGVDVPRFLDRAEEMVQACMPSVPLEENPGAVLGIVLATLGLAGHDKVTIVTSPGIHDFGAWLEQLLAESTGKLGKGLIPVDREKLGPPAVYGADRVFVYLRLATDTDSSQETRIAELEKAGQPVVRIHLAGIYDLGQEFFRWELATAVAGAVLRINPFDQPDVEASKIATRELTSQYEASGALPSERPFVEDQGIQLFADQRSAGRLMGAAGNDRTLAGVLRAHLNQLSAGDYLALLAYIEMNQANEDALQLIRHQVRDRKRVATCLGFGPRFLHSTGQAYKGGPNSGVLLQITTEDPADLPVPGQKYTFGVVKAAQARGDFQVLAQRNRRALRVHLAGGVDSGLKKLQDAVRQALT